MVAANSTAHQALEVESTYTAALWVDTPAGEECVRLKGGLFHGDAMAFAETAADQSSLNVIAVAAILDRVDRA